MDLKHKKLHVYALSVDIVEECYRITSHLPAAEKFNLVSQIRRASLSIAMNIAEGASRNTRRERKRYYEVARGSLVETDTALTICIRLHYIREEDLSRLVQIMGSVFNMLSKMITTLGKDSASG